jgi:hypothetical protein
MTSEAAFDVPAGSPEAASDRDPHGDVPELKVGWFGVPAAGGRCWWSDGMYELHALAPGDVVPTLALVLAHQHPEDRPRVAGLLAAAAAEGRGFACVSRLVDFEGRVHDVVLSVSAEPGPGSGPYAVEGAVVVLDAVVNELARRRADVQLEQALESRSAIDQAKGVLALARGYDAGQAFDALRLASQQRNVRVRALADEVLRRARTADADAVPAWLDEVLGDGERESTAAGS